MSRHPVLMLVPIMIIASLYVAPLTLRSAYAATAGEVCVATNGANTCPIVPPLFNYTSVGSQLRVSIVINSSQPFNVFDISILTNNTILKPAGVDLTGTILQGSPSELTKCIGGTGSGCSSIDDARTLHYAVSGTALTNGFTATGLLFTAIFNVTKTTTVTTIRFQAGCSSTSVPGVCVTISNGTPTPLAETTQGARYSNLPYFDLQPPENSLTVDQGGTDTSLYLNVTSLNKFQGTVQIATTVNSTVPTVVLSLTSLTVSLANPQNFSFVTVHVPPTTTPGTYNITFVATSSSLPPNILYIPLHVPTPDFTITANPTAIVFNVSVSGFSNITVNSIGNFSGRVTLGLTASPGLQAALVGGSSFNINLNTPARTTLKVNSTNAGSYNVNITATSGSIAHTVKVQFLAVDFEMHISTGGLALQPNKSGVKTIFFKQATSTPYNMTVIMTRIEVDQVLPGITEPQPSTGISVSCVGNSYANAPSEVVLNKTNTYNNFATCKVTGYVSGNYTVTVIGTSGTSNHAAEFPVQVLGPDFTIVASPAAQTLPLGNSVTVTATLTRTLALNDSLTVSGAFSTAINGVSPGLPVAIQTVFLNATSPKINVTFTITSMASTPTGAYTLLITGLGKFSSITHATACLIVVVSTASPVDIRVTSVTASTSSATVGSAVTITVQVKNFGKIAENSTVIALAGDLSVDQRNVTLAPGQNLNVTLTWKTDQFAPGSFVIGGQILGVPGEANYANNLMRSSTTVILTAANSNPFSSPYLVLGLVIGIIAVAVVLVLTFMSKRKASS